MAWQVRHVPVKSLGVTGDSRSGGFVFIPITGDEVPEGVVFTIPAPPNIFVVEVHVEGRKPRSLGVSAPGRDEFTSDDDRRQHWEQVATRVIAEEGEKPQR